MAVICGLWEIKYHSENNTPQEALFDYYYYRSYRSTQTISTPLWVVIPMEWTIITAIIESNRVPFIFPTLYRISYYWFWPWAITRTNGWLDQSKTYPFHFHANWISSNQIQFPFHIVDQRAKSDQHILWLLILRSDKQQLAKRHRSQSILTWFQRKPSSFVIHFHFCVSRRARLFHVIINFISWKWTSIFRENFWNQAFGQLFNTIEFEEIKCN